MSFKTPSVLLIIVAAAATAAPAQTTPSVSAASGGAPRPLAGLSSSELAYFNEGLSRFLEIDSVSGTQPGAAGSGLGPRFNMNSCAGCHAQPAPGGSSPKLNPQVSMASSYGAANTLPSFIQADGPVRVVRFLKNTDGTPDGGVHDLFVITGRSDAAGCKIAQPDFATAQAAGNIALRVPTPVFGAGLIQAIPDSTILAGKSINGAIKAALGISGRENRNGNDGTITRFGWKAQNKSLEIFSGEAYNVEQGVTNEIFPQERDETPGCGYNTTPEDVTNITVAQPLKAISDVTGFGAFMRFLAPPQPQPDNPSIVNGRRMFALTGCALCHTPSMTTGNASSPALRNQQANLYSDLLLHNMGSGLADGVSQGNAQGNEFRTAPLWGLGTRLYYLHDGRTSDLTQAVQSHASSGSEANAVITAYNLLPGPVKQDLLNFLMGL